MRRLSGVEMPIIPDLDIARAVAPVEAAVAELLRDLVHLVHLARLVVQLLLARAAPGHGLANWNSDSVHFFYEFHYAACLLNLRWSSSLDWKYCDLHMSYLV